ncbi:MAG: CDP-diacylglycerol--glycerol-3-phosphate 3-phosphatidyltransferase [Lachnospiraceae bacterium]
MNLPNKLTLFRVFLIIPFVFFMLAKDTQTFDYIALALFVIASLTDLLDGYIARKYHLITNFGKFMDPLADKLLVSAAMICLVEMGRLSSIVVVLIISREFIISGFRLIASDNGVVIAASNIGKIKTVFQMIMVCLLILNLNILQWITSIVVLISVILTIVSLVDYLYKNKAVMKDVK